MGAEHDRDCTEHVWELRGVTFDLETGATEDYECVRCLAVTVKQQPAPYGYGPGQDESGP